MDNRARILNSLINNAAIFTALFSLLIITRQGCRKERAEIII